MDYVYRFPVVRGIQAGREYYIAMVPLKMLSILFPNEEEYVLPEFRAQRRLNEARIPIISKYIIENRNNYVFSALAASIDGKYKYVNNADSQDVGVLEVSMDAKFLLNDGQHRKAAILDALEEDSSLNEETIAVVLYEDKGLERSQQIFTDLNKHAVKTSNSISELYDSRDVMAVMTREVVSKISFFERYTDKEKDNLGKYASNLFTLNTFYNANKRIVGNRKIDKEVELFVYDFWKEISKNIVPWNELNTAEISKKALRENYIVTQGVVIKAFGQLGNYFFENKNCNYKEKIKKLQEIDWKRNSEFWLRRAIRLDGRMITNEKAIRLITNRIKTFVGIPLSKDEERIEIEFKTI